MKKPPPQRDTWLYGSARRRKAVAKAAVEVAGQFDPASDATNRFLSEDPRDRARAASRARIVHLGVKDNESTVSVIRKAADDGDSTPKSRQLADPFTTFYVQGVALEPPLPPERLLNLTEESPFHSACLAAKATDSCGRGWEFAPKDEKESDEELGKSDAPAKLKALLEDITPNQTFGELLVQAAWEYQAIGWGVWEVVRKPAAPGEYGEPAALFPIPAHTIRATLDPRKWVQIRAGRVRYFKDYGAECTINLETGTVHEWRGKGKREAKDLDESYVASELIVFKEYTPRSLWYGLPKWISAIATIAELGAIREFNVSWFASGGQVDYHMHFKAGSLEMAKEMKQQVEDQTRENAGRGHSGILTAGDETTDVTVAKLGEMLREGHFRFRRGDLVKEILIAHGVPPYRIGWAETGSLGGNAAPEMLGAYSAGVIKPIQQVIIDRLRVTLFDAKKGIKTGEFRLKLADLDLENVDEERKTADSGAENGALSPNQWREHMGMDPIDDDPAMDKHYYHGQELGKEAPDPFGGGGFGGSDPSGGWEDATDDPAAQGGAFKRKSVDVARAVVISMLRGYESQLKAAFDEEQAAAKPPRRRAKS